MRVLLVQNHLRSTTSAVWRSLEEQGIDLHVVHEAGEEGAADLGLSQTHPLRVKHLRRGQKSWDVYPGLARLVHHLRPDVLHVWGEAWSIAAQQALGIHKNVVIHGAETRFQGRGPVAATMRAPLVRRAGRRTAAYMAWSRYGMEAARPHVVAAVTGVASPILPDIAPSPAQGGQASSGALTVGYVGRLEFEKGPDLLIDAARDLDLRSVRFEVVGAPRGKWHVKALGNVPANVRFRGPVEHRAIPGFMAGLDLLVVPTRDLSWCAEQFSLATVEAMAAGTPVLGSDSGALPEVIGHGGFLFRANSRSALEHALDDVLSDPDELRRMRRRAHQWATHQFHPAISASRLRGVWEELTA